MSSPYRSNTEHGSPSGSPNSDAHGGNIDPFAMTFERADGIPTQSARVTQYSAPMNPTYSPPPAPSSPASKVARVPVGGRNNYIAAITSKDQANASVSEVFSTAPSSQAYTPIIKHDSSDMYDVEIEAAQNHEEDNYHVTRTPLKGYLGNFFSRSTRFRLTMSPHSIQKAGHIESSDAKFRHQDSLQRVYEGKNDDRFINPVDGRVQVLVVQCTDRVYRGPKNSTYQRTFIRNVAPITLRVASWPTQHLDDDPKSSGARRWGRFLLVVKWPMTCFLLNHMVGIPYFAATGVVLNNGCYDPFPYRYWGYCKVTWNAVEESAKASPISAPGAKTDVDSNRILEPVCLCFVGDEEYGRQQLVADWKVDPKNAHHHGKCPEYLFIAYTTEHFRHDSMADIQALHSIATQATRASGLTAYWVGASCMVGKSIEDNVFLISDIVRGAHSLVIAIGSGANDWEQEVSIQILLQQWGQRLWTLPEALLITPHRPIAVYRRGHPEPLIVPKKQIATFAWADSATTRQLVDHYEGNLTLSRLELVIIAMQSLFARKTTEYLPGDHSYALMGLLRLRPKIDRTDSSFQAFARLSLANDSDMLLERLMCILPRDPAQHWSSVADAYDVNVWDIYPTCQIAGVCDKDTILVDGAFGATIHWDKFRKVANTRRVKSWKRLASQTILHGAPYFFTAGVAMYRAAWDSQTFIDGIQLLMTQPGKDDAGHDVTEVSPAGRKAALVVKHWAVFIGAIGFIFVAMASFVFLCSPYLTRLLYRGKFWGTQAWLFGFEGYADLETIESQIFGSKMRRLRWSTYGSSLSRHRKNAFNESVGVDPTTDPIIRNKVEAAITNTKADALRVFTLVDTNTMTVTMFEAVKPPVAVLLCGTEGGMQRAVACSYEWTSGICYRETVLRMETTVLEKMSRVSRFRFGMNRG